MVACVIAAGCATPREPWLSRAVTTSSTTVSNPRASSAAHESRDADELLVKLAPAFVQLHAPMPERSARPALRVVSGRAFEVARAGPLGTGVVVGPRLVLTAHHVVEHARNLRAKLHDGRDAAAAVIAREPSVDLALLQLEPSAHDLTPIRVCERESSPGTWIMVVGHLYDEQLSVTLGVVTSHAPNEAGQGAALEVDAAVNLLNTGGPIVNGAGELVGIASAKQTEARGMRGLGYGTPASASRAIVASAAVGDAPLRKPMAREQNPLRGIQTEDLDDTRRSRFTVRDDVRHGAVITEVERGSPAANVGLAVGDVVVEVDFEPVWSADSFQEAASEAAGPEMILVVRGDAATYVLLHP